MLTRRLSGALLVAVTFAFFVSMHSLGCSSSSNGNTTDGGSDVVTTDTTFTQDGNGKDSPSEAVATCPTGQTSCNGTCTNTASDPKNCGVCGATCGSGLVCSMSTCALSCSDAGGLTQCGSGCYDLTSDSDNCGSCGNKCPTGEVCANSTCGFSCGAGSTLCGGACVDTNTDNANCGKCGTQCTAGTVCGGGTCALTCMNGYTTCDADAGSAAYCADTKTDNLNCGSCGNQCPGGQVCSLSKCSTSCGTGLIDCSGKCVDPTSDNNYCGATTGCGIGDAGSAGTVCPSGTACSSGVCSISCPAGEVNCSGICVDPLSNNLHCGVQPGCTGGAACGTGTVCSNGACGTNCAPGQVLCSGTCIDPTNNITYCGATGNCTGMNAGSTCQPGQVCTNKVCQLTCANGLVACAGTCIDPVTNDLFCGASGDCTGANAGVTCPGGNICSNSMCQLTCQSGLRDCDNTCVDPLTSNTYCGAVGTCSSMTPGDPNYMGMVCPPGEVCSGGSCGTTCLNNEALCDLSCINPLTDNGYCGAAAPSTDVITATDDGGPNTGCSSSDPTSSQYAGVNCAGVGGEQCNAGLCICPYNVSTHTAPFSSSNNIVCGTPSSCVDPTSNNQFCGAQVGCGKSTLPNDGTGYTDCSSITGSHCAAPGLCVCPGNLVNCFGNCIDPKSDDTYCGAVADATPGGGNCTGYPAQACSTTSGASCTTNSNPNGSCTCPKGGDNVQQVACTQPAGHAACIDPSVSATNCGAMGSCGDAPGTPVTPGAATQPSPTYGDSNFQGYQCAALPLASDPGFGAGYVCQNSECVLVCQKNQVICLEGPNNTPTCIDPTSSSTNCDANGACNVTAGGPVNPEAASQPSPTYGTTDFQGYTCANANNATNPGFGAGYVCQNSQCVLTCQSGDVICPDPTTGEPTCINPQTNNNNCGAAPAVSGTGGGCSVASPATDPNYEGVPCTGIDQCQKGLCTPLCGGGESPCPTVNPTYCANLTSDNANCGTCSNACTGGNSCSPTGAPKGQPQGACGPSCVSPQILCPGASPPTTSYCANTQADNQNCGSGAAGCGQPCATGTSCQNGRCLGVDNLSFSTCGATGPTGPTQAQCNSAYSGEPFTSGGAVTVTGGGVQTWTVPTTGSYVIEAIGAQGAAADPSQIGGYGADMLGTFSLTQGAVLTVVVGQMGVGQSTNSAGGGGGGTYVVVSGTPLVVAGGGGGGYSFGNSGQNASTTQTGVGGIGEQACSGSNGGTSGAGGGPTSCYYWAGCGGGFVSGGDGAPAGEFAADSTGAGGLSFVDGATGGTTDAAYAGGFGGGGASAQDLGGGGGGGYSGGGAGDQAGGGGSFNSGAGQSNTISTRSGDGVVFITLP